MLYLPFEIHTFLHMKPHQIQF